jgi:putative endonuclease
MALSLSRGRPFTYMLRLRSGAIYVGCSVDVEVRFNAHAAGTACRTTALDPPTAVIFVEVQVDFASARRREAQLKRWSRAKKEALASADLQRLQRISRSRI